MKTSPPSAAGRQPAGTEHLTADGQGKSLQGLLRPEGILPPPRESMAAEPEVKGKVGQRVSLYPGPARNVIEQGSEIGNHSWGHGQLDGLEKEKVLADLQSVTEQVYSTVGQAVTFMRPPYGRYSEAVIAAARELNQHLVLWDVDPRDWEDPPPGRNSRKNNESG